MINDKNCHFFSLCMVLDETGRLHALFNVEVRTWLIKDIEIRVP